MSKQTRDAGLIVIGVILMIVALGTYAYYDIMFKIDMWHMCRDAGYSWLRCWMRIS